MATWIAHLRVAERLLEKGYDFEKVPFVVGNIGPDSGVPNEDWSAFDPPTSVTHWRDENNHINPDNFYNKYLIEKEKINDKDRLDFYIGYYVHLLTDVEWTKFYEPKKNDKLHKDNFKKDPNFIWVIKKDWYGLDFLYLEKNPNSVFYTCFQNINNFPDYLDYYPNGAFSRQVKYITNYYLGKNEETKDSFVYLTEKEMNAFVDNAVETIADTLKGKHIYIK